MILPLLILGLAYSTSAYSSQSSCPGKDSDAVQLDRFADQISQVTGNGVSWDEPPKIQERGRVFEVTAVATFSSPLQTVIENAVSYEQYPIRKIPTVREVHIVSKTSSEMTVWFHTAFAGQDAKYYMAVHLKQEDSGKTTVITWQTTPKLGDWTYPENKTLKNLSGSFRITSQSPDKTSVKYDLIFEPNTKVPGFLVRLGMQRTILNEVRAVFDSMAIK